MVRRTSCVLPALTASAFVKKKNRLRLFLVYTHYRCKCVLCTHYRYKCVLCTHYRYKCVLSRHYRCKNVLPIHYRREYKARISQIKHQLDATLCRFCFCRVTLHVSGVKRPSSGVFKTGTAATGTCVMVAGRSSHHHIRDETMHGNTKVKCPTSLILLDLSTQIISSSSSLCSFFQSPVT